MTITKEGAIASFYTVNKAPIKHLKVYFSPKQAGEGTPSSENIRPIEGWNSIDLLHSGKNLVQNANVNRTTNGVTFTINNDGSVHVQGTATYNAWWSYAGLPTTYLKAGTYNLSGGNPNAPLYLVGTDDDGTEWSEARIGGTDQGNGRIFTLTQGATVRYQIVGVQGRTIDTIVYPMLTKVEETNGYENYKGIKQAINFPQTIYGGYIDLITGELVQTHYISQINKVNKYSNDEGYFWYTTTNTINIPAIKAENAGLVADRFKIVPGLGTGNAENQITFYSNGIVRWKENENMSLTEYENYLTNNPFTICYELATPIILGNISPIELQSFIGQNNIWSNATKVEVEYDLAESNDELYRRRNIILNSSPHVESTSGTIASFSTDMKAPVVDLKAYFTPVQEGSGDPSPENVRPIHGWTKVGVNQTGKNIINLGTKSFTRYKKIALDFPIKAGTYVFSASVESTDNVYDSSLILFSDTDTGHPVWSGGLYRGNRYSKIVTFSTDITHIFLYASVGYQQSAGFNATWTDMQLELASSATSYEAFIQGSTFQIAFPASGNLLNPISDNAVPFENESYSNYTLNDGIITTTGNVVMGFKVKVNPSTKYTFSFDSSSTVMMEVFAYETEPSVIHNNDTQIFAHNANSQTFTTPSNCNWITCGFYVASYGITVKDFKLYEPSITIYGGYVDLIRGKVVSTYQKIILDGISYEISNYGNSTYNGTEATNRGITIPRTGILTNNRVDITKVFSSTLIPTTSSIWSNPNNYKWHFTIYNHSQLHICFDNSVVGITSDMNWTPRTQKIKEWLMENNIIVILPLETPIEYDLTPQQIKTLKGTNNIWSDANGNIEVKYWTH